MASPAPPAARVAGAPPRAFLLTLAAPGLALSLAVTVVSAYAPPLVAELSSAGVAGAIIGAEGVFALLVPVAIGARSDRTRSRLGSRMPFLAIGALLAVAALVAIPAAGSLAVVALALGVFYVGYFTAYAPYRALYPDCVAPDHQGRALGLQSTLREVGLGLALVGGGVLFATGQALPFVVAAAVVAAIMGVFVLRVRDPALGPAPELGPLDMMVRRPGAYRASLAIVRRRPDLRRLLAANALWELAQAALKSFAVLFITAGLGRSAAFASLVFAVVAVAAVGAALAGGVLADRRGFRALVLPAVVVYGLGALALGATQSVVVLAAVPLLAFAAALVATLSFAWVSRLTADEDHGLTAGLFGLSQGAGIVLGPVLAGLAVELAAPALPGTDGYAAIFVVAGVAVLASLALVARVPDAPA
jgi:Na+/melibiose symporter-like transporter